MAAQAVGRNPAVEGRRDRSGAKRPRPRLRIRNHHRNGHRRLPRAVRPDCGAPGVSQEGPGTDLGCPRGKMIPTTMDTLGQKSSVLEENLRALCSALVAYSGGVDSAYLTWAARQVLGDKMLAVLADSPSFAAFQKRDA